MAFEDETLVCKDCGKEFIFSAGEQEFYAEKGFENKPVRCRDCRDKIIVRDLFFIGGKRNEYQNWYPWLRKPW